MATQHWLGCILTKDGLRLYVREVTPKRTTTADRGVAGTFGTQGEALRVARTLCPAGGRFGAERADDR